jgi:hypothetical protein
LIVRNVEIMELAVTTWSGIHGLSLLIANGYLTRLAASDDLIDALAQRVARLLLDGIRSGESH